MFWRVVLATTITAQWPSVVAAQTGQPQVFGFQPLVENTCQPSCSIDVPDGQPPFTLTYSLTRNEDDYDVKMTLNDDMFNLEVADSTINRGRLSFHYYHFPGSSHHIYGLDDLNAASTTFIHYFVRDGDDFHYLGSYGWLSYDTNEKLFISLEPREAPCRWSGYRLEGNSFRCEKGLCNGTCPDSLW